ncbi:MAG: EAL domain-containing protein [Butyrivibrio sp.]|uniref:EAL domain-containing protein n=1 Tax=Butyrivibrio sp. TaxID=28121 RepID=UPI0025F117B9|nr:EAL domain-containing protein [Butyrivibrio sp.]MCR5772206.1 EAL domain-containing protein [Butyrivibrio sp.]
MPRTGLNDTISRIFDTFVVVSKSRYAVVYDIFNHYARWSTNAVEFFGLSGEYIENADDDWHKRIHPDDRKNYEQRITAMIAGINQEAPMEYRAMDKNGEYVACSSKGTIIKDYSGRPAYLAFFITNHGIVSNRDPITDTDNLYQLFNELRQRRDRKQKSVVLVIDTIRFDDINRTYGYSFGNQLLKAQADLFSNLVKSDGKIYRGDGTSLVAITGSLSLDEVRRLYSRMREQLKTAFYVAGTRVPVSIAGGIVVVENFALDEHTIYTSAKYALDVSKDINHGGLVVYHNEHQEQNARRIELLDAIRADIMNRCEGFYLVYQPIVSSKDNHMIGAEVLIRWKSEKYGEVMPDTFIPLLENDSVFFELGNWILEQAFNETRGIVAVFPDFMLNINLTFMQLERSEFRTTLMELLRRTRFPVKNLTLELTKRCRDMSREHLKSQVDFMKSLGSQLALDVEDFSSLDLLRLLPIDLIKIDRRFLRDIDKNLVNQYIVEAMSGFARNMNVHVALTGIENAEMLGFVRDKFPADSFQGYYYSKPVKIEELKKLPLYHTN